MRAPQMALLTVAVTLNLTACSGGQHSSSPTVRPATVGPATVSAHLSCPAPRHHFAQVPPKLHLHNAGYDVTRHLVPKGPAPAGATICVYGGSNARPVAPRPLVLDAAQAAVLAQAAYAVPIVEVKGPVSCPDDFGAASLITFAYRTRPDVELDYQTSGCQSLSDGSVFTDEVTNPPFYNGFESIYDDLVTHPRTHR